jgi:hypothetical protein
MLLHTTIGLQHRLTQPASTEAWRAAWRGFLALMLSLLGSAAMAIEEPAFSVLIDDKPYELRRYEGYVVAETLVSGDFDSASRAGFRRIAGYIFGDNQAASGTQRNIAMTAPVTVEPQDNAWRLHFVMPSAESLATLPKPNNPEVRLRTVEPHFVASIRFSGFTTASSIEAQTRLLQSWITKQKLEAIGQAQVARYNDPFTLPWNRRNEILIPVKP